MVVQSPTTSTTYIHIHIGMDDFVHSLRTTIQTTIFYSLNFNGKR
jgi:hypothetical protein